MGVGLSENSPVVLSLGRANYEALIKRHGQWVRWRTAAMCPCVEKNTQQPDPHCEKCGGRGYIYGNQKEQVLQTTATVDINGILTVSEDYTNDSLVKVYDQSGKVYSNARKYGQFIDLNTDRFVRGSYYNVVLNRELAKTIENTILEDCGGNYYKVPGIESKRLNIEGIYYTAPADILSIESVTDEEGEEFEVEQYRLNLAYIPPKIVEDEETGEETEVYPTGNLTAKNIKYIEPFTFAVLNQNLNKVDIAQMEAAHGDAVVTFPYSCDVSESDVLTVLAGTITQKSMIVRTKKDYDTIPAFFIESIVKIIGEDSEYENGVDYVLVGTNSIKWISDNKPDSGEGYSIIYKVYPTYTVVKNIPQLRSSENQRFPKKAIVQLMSSYSETRGVNRQ